MIKLKDGREIQIDLYALSVLEVRALSAPTKKGKDDTGDESISKVTGLTVAELQALPFPDYRKITAAFWKLVLNPLADDGEQKNSVSESTSE